MGSAKRVVQPFLALACGVVFCVLSAFGANPVRAAEAVLSFQHSMKSDDVKAFLRDYPVMVESVFQSVKCKNNTFSGAYVACTGKDFDRIIKDYKKEYLASLSGSLADARKDILNRSVPFSGDANIDDPLALEKNAEDRRAVKALEKYAMDLQQALDILNTEGILIYGLKIKGARAELEKMAGNKAVRAIEYLDGWNRGSTPIEP